MRRFATRALLTGSLVLMLAPAVGAGENWLYRSWKHYWLEFHRSNSWPISFVPSDRATTYAPFAAQTAGGWRVQNTINQYHFEEDGVTLNEAGRLKVVDIIHNSPPAYRAVFVAHGSNRKQTAGRMMSVERYLAHTDGGQMVNVVPIYPKDLGTPADYVDNVYRQFQESTPEPRLPAGASGAGGTGGLGSQAN